ncbi:leucine zipper protein 1 [Rhinophrynus dorsalis]
MEHSSRHLRFKLQSLGRRLDDLEEATRNLQKAEDEVLELQDKIIQAEGSNSSMLADVEALRKRVLKIEGKDEEVKKAEDLCRLIKEKLENEENVTRELRAEIEHLQKRMTELEKLEEAFSKSKNDCTQLCLSLNEEKNMSKKLTSELEILRARVKELESSENKLDKAEQFLTSELEKIKVLTSSFVNERKCFLEKEKQNEKLIIDLRHQLELKGKLITVDQTRNESNRMERTSDQLLDHNLRIEDSLTPKLSQRAGFNYIKQSENQTTSKDENEKNKNQEDNKIKDLNQEIEKLKNQIRHFEGIEEELKQLKEKNGKLQETCVTEQNKSKRLAEEILLLKSQSNQCIELENGVLDGDEITLHNRFKNERTKSRGVSSEPLISKCTPQDLSPKLGRREKNHELEQNIDSQSKRHLISANANSRRPRSSYSDLSIVNTKKQDKLSVSSNTSGAKDVLISEMKKSKDQPSVLSRYPPAAQEQNAQKPWKASASKKMDRSARLFGEDYSVKLHRPDNSRKEISTEEITEHPLDNSYLTAEVVLVENHSINSSPYTEPVYSGLDGTNALDNSSISLLEDQSKATANIEQNEDKETPSQDRSSRYAQQLQRDNRVTNSTDTEPTTKSFISSKDGMDPLGNEGTQSRYYASREKPRPISTSKPQIPEKPNILESTENKEWEKRNISSRIQTRRPSSPKEKRKSQQNNRVSQIELNTQASQRDSETFRKMSFDSIENLERRSNSEMRTRPYSPREALQSTVIIKPVIIEKDTKESMGEYRARSTSDFNRSQINTAPNKVTSTVTFYPTETAPTRLNTEETTRERHTSTSNIRLSANDQSLLKNNVSIPVEISINKRDVLKVMDKDDDLDSKDINKASDVKEQKKTIDVETLVWKSHDVDVNHIDGKPLTVKSSWRSVLGSTEDLDILSNVKEDSVDTTFKGKTYLDEERPVKLRPRELYSRNKSSVINRCTSPEVTSKRSYSSLNATEIMSRRNESLFSLGQASWNRLSSEGDDNLSSRRKKQGSEKLTKSDTAGRRSLQNQRLQKSMVEERIRQLEH